MPSITFDNFSQGIDLRSGAAVSDSNILLDAVNVYIDDGKGVRMRGGLRLVKRLQPGSKGLTAFNGELATFSGDQEITHGSTDNGIQVVNHRIPFTADDTQKVAEVHNSDSYEGGLYVSLTYENGARRHSYEGVNIADPNCPHSKEFVVIKSKIFAIKDDGDVAYTSTVNGPADWSEIDDAGFISTTRQAPGSTTTQAVSEFGGSLVIMMPDSIQIWFADADPANIALQRTLRNVGTVYPKTLVPFYRDLFFLSPFGYRSVGRQQYTDSLEDVDVGTPIDDLVLPVIDAYENINQGGAVDLSYLGLGSVPVATGGNPGESLGQDIDSIGLISSLGDLKEPMAGFNAKTGQYICVIGSVAHCYKFSRTTRVSAWSRYDFGDISPDSMAELNGRIYLRQGDDVYLMDENFTEDNGEPFDWSFKLGYQSCKSPGVAKTFHGFDVVVDGKCTISHAFDSNDDNLKTYPLEVEGNTRPYGMLPVEALTVEISPEFKGSSANGHFRLSGITYYYETLNAFT